MRLRKAYAELCRLVAYAVNKKLPVVAVKLRLAALHWAHTKVHYVKTGCVRFSY